MSRDYRECAKCNLGIDSEFGAWCECGNFFCSTGCGSVDNYQDSYDEEEEDSYDFDESLIHRKDKKTPITCCICREEHFTDYILLNGLLEKLNLTREDAISLLKKTNRKNH